MFRGTSRPASIPCGPGHRALGPPRWGGGGGGSSGGGGDFGARGAASPSVSDLRARLDAALAAENVSSTTSPADPPAGPAGSRYPTRASRNPDPLYGSRGVRLGSVQEEVSAPAGSPGLQATARGMFSATRGTVSPPAGSPPRSTSPASEPLGALDLARLRELLAASGPGDPSRAALHQRAAVDAQVTVSEATSYLMGLRGRFPNVFRVLLQRARLPHAATIADFPPVVLVAAVHAARIQEHGLAVLRSSALAAASLAGASGKYAAAQLSEAFDYLASTLLEREHVLLDVAPLDLALGVLPLTALALHLWYGGYHFAPVSDTTLLDAAKALKLSHGGVFDPRLGLPPVFAAYGAAIASGEPIPVDAVCHALLYAVHHD